MLYSLEKSHLPAPVMYFVPSQISQTKLISSSPRTVRIIQKNWKRENRMLWESHIKNSVIYLGTLHPRAHKMKRKKKSIAFFSRLSERDTLSNISESRTSHWFYLIKQRVKHISLLELFQDGIKAENAPHKYQRTEKNRNCCIFPLSPDIIGYN